MQLLLVHRAACILHDQTGWPFGSSMAPQCIPLEDEPVVIDLPNRPWIESLKNNALMGATTPQLLRILHSCRSDVDFVTFAPRLLLLFLLSLLNSLFALFDTILFSRSVAAGPLPHHPVFVIGQPRSGTTLLHNLLAEDARFVTPNTFQVGWPSSFLTMERFASYWPLSRVLSPTRPMDNLPLHWGTPQEDEIATNVLSAGASSYMCTHFPRAHARFLRFVSFEHPDAADALEHWRNAFLFFCRKLMLRARPGQRLLLKSPVHTGRMRLLDSLFGGSARFILVHRDPHEVFRSNHAALMKRYIRPCAALQRFSAGDAQRYILAQGALLHRLFVRDAKVLPPGRVALVRFEELVHDPVRAMREAVYRPLGMDIPAELGEKLQMHALQASDFQQNTCGPVTQAQRGVVLRQWADMFDDFGYDREAG